jgi:hypothetical protein
LRGALFYEKGMRPFLVDGVVAQLVERLVRNEKVAGSIPVGSTNQNPKDKQPLVYFPIG